MGTGTTSPIRATTGRPSGLSRFITTPRLRGPASQVPIPRPSAATAAAALYPSNRPTDVELASRLKPN